MWGRNFNSLIVMSGFDKILVEKAMEIGLSRTTILSDYKGGYLTQLCKYEFIGNMRTVYKLECKNVTRIFKVLSANINNAEAIRLIKEEYEISIKAYNADQEGVAEPIDIKDAEDQDRSEYSVETLFEYCGTNILTALKDADSKKIMEVMTNVSLIMENLEEKKIFHFDLRLSFKCL